MKRSEIEAAIDAAEAAFAAAGQVLPPFAKWTEADWSNAAPHATEAGLGWDVTDYGMDDFAHTGLTLLTVRNSSPSSPVPYAEKLMYLKAGQYAPMHRHRVKVEDIILRSASALVLELHPSAPDGQPDRSRAASVLCDGVAREIGADGLLRLRPGESVRLTTDIWHAFWAEAEEAVVGEVSSVNDDVSDNIFEVPVPRFPTIEEDMPIRRPIVADRIPK